MEALNYIAACRDYVLFGLSDNPRGQIELWQPGNPYPIELLGGWLVDPRDRATLLDGVLHYFHAQRVDDSAWCRVSRAQAERRLANLAVEANGEFWTAHKIDWHHRRLPAPGSGGHLARRVMTPLGEFRSANAAAKAHGITRQAVSENALRHAPGWHYI